MTDMIKNVAHDLGGIGIYGILSILMFFAFFTGMIVWALCARKSYVDKMQALPLEDGSLRCTLTPETRDSQGNPAPHPEAEGELPPAAGVTMIPRTSKTIEVSHE